MDCKSLPTFTETVPNCIAAHIFPCSIKCIKTLVVHECLVVCSEFWEGQERQEHLNGWSHRLASWTSKSYFRSVQRSILRSSTRLISRIGLTSLSCCKMMALKMMMCSEGWVPWTRWRTSSQRRSTYLRPLGPLVRSKCHVIPMRVPIRWSNG